MIDFATLTIVVVITVAFCAPFVYSHQKKKRHEKGLINDFMAKAQQYQLQIGTYDLWRRSYVIGVDEERSALLYIKFQPDFQEHLIDLQTVKNIRISRQEHVVEGDSGKEKVVEKLWLSLEYSEPMPQDTHLEFYDAEESIGLMGEPLLIKKWHNLLTAVLKSSKATPKRTERKTTSYPTLG